MESEQIKGLLKKGQLWDYIIQTELDKKHKGNIMAKETIFLCAIGSKLINKKPFSFNILALNPSGSGKDNIFTQVLKIFPKEDYESYSRISPTALNYLHTIKKEPDYNYNGKILYLKEISGKVLNNEIMKEFTSGEGEKEDEIKKIAITLPKGLGVDVLEVRGSPSVFVSTAKTIPDEEIINRFNLLTLDISEEQIRRAFTRDIFSYDKEIKEFIDKLKPYEVEIPENLFNFIKDNFPSKKPRHIRDFYKLLDFVKVMTLFHQEEREGKGNILFAEPEDYDRAKDVFMNCYSSISRIPLKDIDDRIIRIIEKINEPMSAKEICNELGGIITLQGLYPHLRNLTSKDILNELTERFEGYVTQKYTLSLEFTDKKPFVLPNYEEDIKVIKDIKHIKVIKDIKEKTTKV